MWFNKIPLFIVFWSCWVCHFLAWTPTQNIPPSLMNNDMRFCELTLFLLMDFNYHEIKFKPRFSDIFKLKALLKRTFLFLDLDSLISEKKSPLSEKEVGP